MTTQEALQELTDRGVHLTVWRLRGMISRSEIPKPRMDSSLRWDWTESDIQKVEEAVSQPEGAVS
jgi:hypothetical protein